MARKLGYGGIANTNGARDFSGKTAAVVSGRTNIHHQMGYLQMQIRGFRSIVLLLFGVV